MHSSVLATWWIIILYYSVGKLLPQNYGIMIHHVAKTECYTESM